MLGIPQKFMLFSTKYIKICKMYFAHYKKFSWLFYIPKPNQYLYRLEIDLIFSRV
jgi:hypothetical protein